MSERAWSFGHLSSTDPVPDDGEQFDLVAALGQGQVRIEHIVSSARPDGSVYDQADDEWVVVVSGHAVLDVDGDTVTLDQGDWVLLPAHMPHRVVSTEAGTRWLAVHVPPA